MHEPSGPRDRHVVRRERDVHPSGFDALIADLGMVDGVMSATAPIVAAPRAPRAARRGDAGTGARIDPAERAFLLQLYAELIGGIDGPVVPFPIELVAGEHEAPELDTVADVVNLSAYRARRQPSD